ncbi:MAG: efflux RND transporter periplasmic adaptor subunit [Planctomycetota bacterium]
MNRFSGAVACGLSSEALMEWLVGMPRGRLVGRSVGRSVGRLRSLSGRTRRLLASGAAGCLGSLAIVGCAEPEPPPPPPPPTVEVATPMTRDVTEYFRYTGTLESVAMVEIRARVTGYLEEIRFDESTAVEAGDVLFTIEKAPYEIAVGGAEAALKRARAEASLAEARRSRAEQARAADAASDLEVLEAEAELEKALADVLAAEEELQAAELDLSYTDVTTPISGRVDRNYVDSGNLVGGAEPTLLAMVVTLDPMHVMFDVSETIALRYLSAGEDGSVNRGSPGVEVALADEAGFPHKGQVDFVDSVLDADTGTLTVRALLPNPTGKLYPGLFARIRVPWETRSGAVLVHEEAVGTGLEGRFVLVVGEGDVVSRRAITVGERQDDGTVVVLDGLAVDERYVVRGIQKARPGAPVTAKPFVSDAGSGSESGADTGADAAAGGTP